MLKVPIELLWAIIFILLVTCGALWHAEYFYGQRPCIPTQQQAKDGVAGDKIPEDLPASVIGRSCEAQEKHGGENASEVSVLGIKRGEWLIGIVTLMLWGATNRLVRDSRKTSQTQLRAFLFAKSVEHGENVFTDKGAPYIKEYVFFAPIENVGLTPAVEVRVWIRYQVLRLAENKEPKIEWNNRGVPGVVGPQGKAQTGFVTIPTNVMVDLWKRTSEIYIATRIEYQDQFDSSVVHFHEQCFMLDLLRPPDIIDTQQNIRRVTMRAYGPQNRVG